MPLETWVVGLTAGAAVGSATAALTAWFQARRKQKAIKVQLPDGKVVKLDEMNDEQRKQLLRALAEKSFFMKT
jgi:diaminopimelate epimerase